MKIINDTLFIEFAEMVDCGVSENYLRKAKSTGTKCWSFANDPDDKRKVLIEYEKLKDEYKKKIVARYGEPYERMAKQPIRDLIKWDDKAEEFYLGYKYTGTDGTPKPLPIEHVKKYTAAASFLNMLNRVNEDKKALKELLNLTIEKFYSHVLEMITIDKLDLPGSYRRLLAKRKEYNEKGYASLIDWRFGNTIAAKVNDEKSQAVLIDMIKHPNNYDDVFVCLQYNKWANENGYKMIDAATVGNWRRKNEANIAMYREGNSALRNKFLKQAKGHRPTAPMLMLESDDNVLDLLFLDPDDNTPHKYYHKYKAIVVTDSFNDYVLGYAFYQAGTLTKGQTIEVIKAAYLNAMYYLRSITGQWFLPHEIKTDRWALETLRPFYKGLGNYYDTPVGSKNRGYLEQFFGSTHWKRCLKIGANNYSGNNMTAKHRGVNQEQLDRNKKDYPLIGNEAIAQIENFFHRLRHLPQSNGVSKHAQWLEAFNATPVTDKRLINDEQFLLKFGIEHNNNGKGICITNRGVEPQINNVKYSYDLETDRPLMEYVDKSVSILYDPFDMSRVLVTDFDKVRLIGRDARLNPRALHDGHVDSRKYLNATLAEKQNAVELIASRDAKRQEVRRMAGIDTEGLLQAGVMVKEIKQEAEQRWLERSVSGKDDEDFLDQM